MANTNISSPERMTELLTRLRSSQITLKPQIIFNSNNTIEEELRLKEEIISNAPTQNKDITTDKYGNTIIYNTKQQKAIYMGGSGESIVVIGAAGTGKTTCQKGVVSALIQNGHAGILEPDDHKHLIKGTPGIVVVAYTRRAVANIRKNMPADMRANCITIHKLLEYAPEYFDYEDEEGNTKKKMVFTAGRNEYNPLPTSIKTIIYEEGSMLGTELYEEVQKAMPHKHQEIFLGDIQQLPPVFGPAILGFKLLSLPVVELTDVYRQALESPIIRLAHRILSGKVIKKAEFKDWEYPNQLKLHAWKKQLHWEESLPIACTFFTSAIDSLLYNPEEDIILCPFNKSFGTDEINKKIANHIARKRNAETFQIISGRNKSYYSIGDKVLFDKEDAIILRIDKNPAYHGKPTLSSSTSLDYWGHDPKSRGKATLGGEDEGDIEEILKQSMAFSANTNDEEGERKRQASHILTLQMNDSETEITINTAGDINTLGLGYAITIHKSQGSEWRKVFLILHASHATMVQRELLYTACTRPQQELYVICEGTTFETGISSQRVKGNTLEEKAEYFKGKLDRMNKERIS